MDNERTANGEEHLDPDKLISKRQYRMIKAICGNEQYIRAESAARRVTGWNLLDLNHREAHELIQYLGRYGGMMNCGTDREGEADRDEKKDDRFRRG